MERTRVHNGILLESLNQLILNQLILPVPTWELFLMIFIGKKKMKSSYYLAISALAKTEYLSQGDFVTLQPGISIFGRIKSDSMTNKVRKTQQASLFKWT